MWQRVYNGTLHIENVQKAADHGNYMCIARNKHNYTSQGAVEIKVLGKFYSQFDLIDFSIIKRLGGLGTSIRID